MPVDSISLVPGATSQLVTVQAIAPTTSAGVTGIAFNAAGLTAYYKRDGDATWTAITLATMTQGTWVSGGWIEGDATHAVGAYEFGIPDAAIAAGVAFVQIQIQLTASIQPILLRVWLNTTISDSASAASDASTAASAATALQSLFTDMTQGVAPDEIFTAQALSLAPTGGGGGGPSLIQIVNALLGGTQDPIVTDGSGRVVASSVSGAVGSVTGAVGSVTGAVGSVTGNVGGNVAGNLNGNVVGDVQGRVLGGGGHAFVADGVQALGSSSVTVSGYDPGESPADYVLATPSQPIATNASGQVVASSVIGGVGGSITGGIGGNVAGNVNGNVGGHVAGYVGGDVQGRVLGGGGNSFVADGAQVSIGGTTFTVGGYAAGQSPADSILATPANKLYTDANGLVRTTYGIRKNTAFAAFEFGMVNSTTNAPMTGLTVAATRSINGGAYAACTNAVVEVGGGTYAIDLSAADLNGNGVGLRFTATGANQLDVFVPLQQ